jgi:hypothetical protein
VERAYRITGTLEKLAYHIEEKLVPRLTGYRAQWRRIVLWADAAMLGVFTIIAMFAAGWLGMREGWHWSSPAWWQGSTNNIAWTAIAFVAALCLLAFVHFRIRRLMTGRMLRQIDNQIAPGLERGRLRNAFMRNSRPWISIFRRLPLGWNARTRKRLHKVIAEANQYVQILNNNFTDPSGELTPQEQPAVPLAVVKPERDKRDDARSQSSSG